MLSKDLMNYQLSSKGGKMLVDIEDIREFIMDEVKSSQNHKDITRCLEALTGYGTKSSDEENKKWICR
jgi:hypothetical protein